MVSWTLAANYAWGGLEPVGYHAVNLLVHLAAGLLLYGLVRRTLRLPPAPRPPAEAAWLAAAAALLWVVHPLQTESVTYVIQRAESLAGLWSLAALYAVLRGASAARPAPWYAAAVGACWLGLASKEIVAVVPLVVLLYDRVFLAGSAAEALRRRWVVYAGFALGLVGLGVVLAGTLVPGERAAAGFGMPYRTAGQYLASQPGVVLHYLGLALWPAPLCADYWWPVASGIGDVAPALAVVSALLVLAVVGMRHAPRGGFLALAFVLLLTPSSSVVPIFDLAVEHRMYLPLAPLLVGVVLGAHALAVRTITDARARRAVEGTALGVVALALALRTADRNRVYADTVRFWEDGPVCAPRNPRGHFNQGFHLHARGDVPAARAAYERALALHPQYFDATFSLGNALREEGDLEGAIAAYRRATEIAPGDVKARLNLAGLLQERGDPAGAQAAYEAALAVDPASAKVLDGYGTFLVQRDDLAGAVARFRQAVAADPGLVQAWYHLGLALEMSGDVAGGLDALRAANRIDPDHPGTLKHLARVLATAEPPALRDGSAAVRVAERLLAGVAEPDAAQLALLADAYAAAGRSADAVAAARRAHARALAAGDHETAAALATRLAAWGGAP